MLAPAAARGVQRRFDVAVCCCIVALGALQFFFYSHAPDFVDDDVFWADAARSLLRTGVYGIQGRPETNQPPGLAAILAALCFGGGCTLAAALRAMAIFATLGFLVSYALLRQQLPRPVAAAICLLLLSSPVVFTVATESVTPCFPYAFTSMSALLVARQVERATSPPARNRWAAALAALCGASISIASAGIALLGAMGARIGIALVRDRTLAVMRLRGLLAALVIGTAIQWLWMHRQPAPFEWPIIGYPHSYVSQLTVKNGNDPELGAATWRDFPARIAANAIDHSALLARLILRRWIIVSWISVAILGPLLLIVLGWGYSIWQTGGELQDWYFAGYELIYLLWPWNLMPRFFLPVAPLACLYVWRGGKVLRVLARDRPRLVGAIALPLFAILTICAWYWIQGSPIAPPMSHVGLQDETSFACWLVLALVAARMAWGPWKPWISRPATTRLLQQIAAAAAVALVLVGLTLQLGIGREMVDPRSAANQLPPDANAGMWIASHAEANAVIMARHVPLTYHYSGRKVVWFPPSSNPRMLMDGIRRLGVNYVIVVHRQWSYYLPPDDDSFAHLLAAYPDAVRLVFADPQFRIFRVVGGSLQRTGWDSNPRYPYGHTGFRDRLLQPLGHLS